MTKKLVFIIPGFRHKPTSVAYKILAVMLRKSGYHPIMVKIPWKQRTISQNTEYFLKIYKKTLSVLDSKITYKTYILGFSFGAMIAFIASSKITVHGLILCSLSPYFKEDLSRIKDTWHSSLQIKRYEDFSQLHSATLARKTKAKKVMMLYGEKETKPLIRRVTNAYRQLVSPRKYLIPIGATEHNIGDKKYLQTIHHVTHELL